MTLSRFMRWLGYSSRYNEPWSRIDLDVTPPRDLGEIMEAHAGIAPEVVGTHRLSSFRTLPLHLRRTFCPQCWQEDGPYRRREWASGWSLLCIRHHCLLREKPPFSPSVEDVDRSWLEFYETPRLWRDRNSCWESAEWLRLCAALGVEPRTEAMHAQFWLRELQRLAGRTSLLRDEHDGHHSRYAEQRDERVHDQMTWRVKRDLVMYAVLKFSGPSLLKALDPKLTCKQLIDAAQQPGICRVTTPEVEHSVRLFAAMVAGHLWQRLTQGRWQCRQSAAIEAIVSGQRRSNDEDFWIERHLHFWPTAVQRAGRELFRKPSGWTGVPPWAPCRDHCIRGRPRADRRWLSVSLERNWKCSAPWWR